MNATIAIHQPVLLQRCVDLLTPALCRPQAVMIDCTLGLGGHSQAVLQALPQVRIIGIDRDNQALSRAQQRLAGFGERVSFVHTTYDHIDEVARQYGSNGQVNAILMDLGVSSLQLDDTERGFSYARDGAIDMRMDQSKGQSGADLVNSASEDELTAILRDFGQERFARAIARRICKYRDYQRIDTTAQLVHLVRDAIPAPARRTGGNPAKRTFQALRIAVNGELDCLLSALPKAIAATAVGGRLVVESYQSLEDRAVKRAFTQVTTVDVPPGMPVVPENLRPQFVEVFHGSQKADKDEIEQNPRSASVRLRAIERILPPTTRS